MPITAVWDDQLKRDVMIGWDMCGNCGQHVSRCEDHESEPPRYITTMLGAPRTSYERPESEPVKFVAPEGFVKPQRDPLTGRKIRRDKGQPRGPRTTATPIAQPSPGLKHPCARHTAESRMQADGTYRCTVAGCPGIA